MYVLETRSIWRSDDVAVRALETGNDHRPWTYDNATEDTIRSYINMRCEPYLFVPNLLLLKIKVGNGSLAKMVPSQRNGLL
jgi:hypothetical protein